MPSTRTPSPSLPTALSTEILPYDELFPQWTIEIVGALSGTGGSTDAERRIVTIYRNRGRSVDDFARTILHEYGHVVDTERLDDEASARYLTVAGYSTGTEWRDADARRSLASSSPTSRAGADPRHWRHARRDRHRVRRA